MPKSSRGHRKQKNVTPNSHTRDSAAGYAAEYADTYDYKRSKKSPIKFLGAIRKALDFVFSMIATAGAAIGVTLYKAVMSPEAQVIFGVAQWIYLILISIDNFYVILSDNPGLVPTPGNSQWIGWIGYNPLNFRVDLWMLFVSFLAMGIFNMNQTLLLGICFNPRAQQMSNLVKATVIPLGVAAFLYEFALAFIERPTFMEGMSTIDSLLLSFYNIVSVVAISAGAHFFILSIGNAEAVGKKPNSESI
ncbi:MAG: hypothetical protein F6K26_03405 [Moorea sp. SIO2I5]|nr:hypothetical protein [Moorena sp. SIO2I5]